MTSFFSFSPRCRREDFVNKAIAVGVKLNWKLKKTGADYVQFSTGISFKSFGQHITVEFLNEDSATITLITKLSLQITDSGEGHELAKDFIQRYQKESVLPDAVKK
ncbi:MAG TPA: hypothetical protein PKC76_19500 [Saprospiraceae bacterium]|nr:hypothetical protein [Saprospiraceae bacterium]HMP26323.1 hypothetical protein [Saprospiraceae bacterium]